MASDVTVPGKPSDTAAAPVKTDAVATTASAPVQAVIARPDTSVAVRTVGAQPALDGAKPLAKTAPAIKAVASKAKAPVAKKKTAAKAVAVKSVEAKPVAKAAVKSTAKAVTPKVEPVRAVTSKPTLKRVQPADALRSMAEQSLAQARTAFAKSQQATESFTKGFESSGEVVQSGLKEIQLRMTEAMEAQTQAAFGFFRAMTKVHSLSEAIDLQSSEMRRGVERTLGEAKEISSLAQAIASKASEPVRKAFDHALNTTRAGH